MTDVDRFLAEHRLNAHQRRGLRKLSNAIFDFEPLDKRGNLGATVADQLVLLGLAETGPCSAKHLAIGYKIGYRLTELGWRVVERLRFR